MQKKGLGHIMARGYGQATNTHNRACQEMPRWGLSASLCACVQTPIRTDTTVQEKIHGPSAQSVERHPTSRQLVPRAETVQSTRCDFFHAADARCHRISRTQQISASFLATATRAILALERLRIR